MFKLKFYENHDIDEVTYFEDCFGSWCTEFNFQGRVSFLFAFNSTIYETAKEPCYYA